MEVYTTELDPEEYDGSVEPLGRWGNRTLDVGGRGVCWLAELEECLQDMGARRRASLILLALDRERRMIHHDRGDE